ncbi:MULTISPECIES: hypothetical protein [Mycobacterium]|uniref:Uncharacterized protein n=3 Tax=Mycobacterium TaxID=1763 RepID=A0A2G5PQH8_MYCCE|nr:MULTISPECIES: hypothetical protein [Mycobacterium]MCV7232761.1 hypothetical protein [Mycobacterium branderi]ORA40899.1 hypothetical protein BST20_01760 [Mycobacterium branderi]PIB80565.1 hypothetical protein CQY23_03220 [Mycobacterium celatum]
MSSRELLALLDELPETSKFKEASERTFRLVEEISGKQRLLLIPAAGRPPKDVKVVATYVDWTFDRKLLARNTRELASLRADRGGPQPNIAELLEPLDAILLERKAKAEEQLRERAKSHIHSGLYGYERR